MFRNPRTSSHDIRLISPSTSPWYPSYTAKASAALIYSHTDNSSDSAIHALRVPPTRQDSNSFLFRHLAYRRRTHIVYANVMYVYAGILLVLAVLIPKHMRDKKQWLRAK